MDKRYAKEIIALAEDAKQTLVVRKEIILDDNTTDEQLGVIIRMMYQAKVRAENDSIERCKKFIQ
jgi:hypothetical protein